ncbi:MAG: Protein cbp3, mitochondrial [Alyxoria varia]|nr:MAG: Protein cbp3, mitochondrial [Alyxoria varia]
MGKHGITTLPPPCAQALTRSTRRQLLAPSYRSKVVVPQNTERSPRSLFDPSSRRYASVATPFREKPSALERAALTVRKKAPGLTETYVAENATNTLCKECARQADYMIPQAFQKGVKIPTNAEGTHIGEGVGWWYESLGLEVTFINWAQISFIHIWLLIVRLRYFPKDMADIWIQHLHNHFFWEAEHRLDVYHGMYSQGVRAKHLKELFHQWRGCFTAYDEGLFRGDAVLGTAVWRNVFKADENVDWRHVAQVVAFMRRGLRALDRAPDRLLTSASIKFGNPFGDMESVLAKSKIMDEPFTREDEEHLSDFRKEAKGS